MVTVKLWGTTAMRVIIHADRSTFVVLLAEEDFEARAQRKDRAWLQLVQKSEWAAWDLQKQVASSDIEAVQQCRSNELLEMLQRQWGCEQRKEGVRFINNNNIKTHPKRLMRTMLETLVKTIVRVPWLNPQEIAWLLVSAFAKIRRERVVYCTLAFHWARRGFAFGRTTPDWPRNRWTRGYFGFLWVKHWKRNYQILCCTYSSAH